jgi:hypothetical protein
MCHVCVSGVVAGYGCRPIDIRVLAEEFCSVRVKVPVDKIDSLEIPGGFQHIGLS